MISNAFTMAVLGTTGFYMIYAKLPRSVRRVIVKYSLLTDFVAMVLTYLLFGSGITALLAGAMCAIIISVMLYMANNPTEFVWFFDALEQVKQLASAVRKKLDDLNTEYKVKKGIPCEVQLG